MPNTEISLDRVHYKVVELSTVTDETIESALNRWTVIGWHFDQIQFVVRDSSRRPSMAFIFFTRPANTDESCEYEVIKSAVETSEDSPESDEFEGDTTWN